MSVKIYNVIGMGFIIGEKLEQDNERIYLKYPAVLVMQAPTPQGPRDMIVESVPTIFEGRDEMLKRFPLKKQLIAFSGKPIDRVRKLYDQYVTQLQTRLTGIQVVGAGAMPKQPINNKPRTMEIV